jgi:hypothetical protein
MSRDTFFIKLDWGGGVDYALENFCVGELPSGKKFEKFRKLFALVQRPYNSLCSEFEHLRDGWEKAMLLDGFRKHYLSLQSCCLSKADAELVNRVIQVAAWQASVRGEEDGYAVCQTKDGAWIVFTEWQDYTGHGCRCGSYTVSTSNRKPISGRPFTSLREAIVYGLTDEGRRVLQLLEEQEGEGKPSRRRLLDLR